MNLLPPCHPQSQKELNDDNRRLEQMIETENARQREQTQQRLSLRRTQSDEPNSILNTRSTTDVNASSAAITEETTKPNEIIDRIVRGASSPSL